jgi:hypothetical protein
MSYYQVQPGDLVQLVPHSSLRYEGDLITQGVVTGRNPKSGRPIVLFTTTTGPYPNEPTCVIESNLRLLSKAGKNV